VLLAVEDLLLSVKDLLLLQVGDLRFEIRQDLGNRSARAHAALLFLQRCGSRDRLQQYPERRLPSRRGAPQAADLPQS